MPDEEIQEPRDVFAEAGITDADFEDDPIVPTPDDSGEEAPSDGPARDENGRFVAKEATEPAVAETPGAPATAAQELDKAPEAIPTPEGIEEAPARFSPDAKAAWATAPAPIRGEVNRAIREMEQGLQGYQATIAPLKSYLDMAGGPEALAQAAQRYVGIEQMLANDPIQGLNAIANNLGTDLRSIAAHVLGQPAPDGSQEMGHLRQQLQQAQAELQTFRQEKTQSTEKMVQDFATAKPRFDELTNEIAWALKTGLARDLESAYEYAERLRPAPQSPAALAAPQAQQPQTPPANLSVDGSPGSSPGYTPPTDRRQNIADRLSQFGVV